MKRIGMATLIVVTVMLVAGGLAAYDVASPKPEATSVTKEDFMVEVSLDKSNFGYREPVSIDFRLTYLGETPIHVYSWPGCPFTVHVENATEVWDLNCYAGFVTRQDYGFSAGQSLAGTVVLDSSFMKYYSSGHTEPAGQSDFHGFSAGGRYRIQFITDIYHNNVPIDPTQIELTTAPLHITITPMQ